MEGYFSQIEIEPQMIVEKIKNGHFQDILTYLCHINENSIILNHIYFKYFASKETYQIILNCIISNIDNVLNYNNNFIIHMNMKNLTVGDIDKHISFLQNISDFFKKRYPNKLHKCYIYNAPFIFEKVYNMISIFIDKDTQQKIELVTNKNV